MTISQLLRGLAKIYRDLKGDAYQLSVGVYTSAVGGRLSTGKHGGVNADVLVFAVRNLA
nr:hypothetical protein [uncultured Pseudomonas sp.]